VLTEDPPIASPSRNRSELCRVSSGVTTLEIETLAERSRTGCSASFEALVVHFEKRIFHFLYQMTRNQHDAEDLTQVTFLKAFQNIHRYTSNHAFSAWLFTIAKRTALNHFRDRRPVEELGPELAAAGENPSEITESADACSDIWRVARSLSRDQYEALWLRYGEGFSISDISRIMSTNGLRVRVLLHRGRTRLAQYLSANKEAVRGSLAPAAVKRDRRFE
jgi:RNA polymerase sigma-70 factor (ECF subfamily)